MEEKQYVSKSEEAWRIVPQMEENLKWQNIEN